jgi:hypothetical protein
MTGISLFYSRFKLLKRTPPMHACDTNTNIIQYCNFIIYIPKNNTSKYS